MEPGNYQLFYNKDILESIGYSEPPKTVDEMYEMAVKATQLDADGNIEVLGYPLFPLASARQELIYAFGGRWWAEDGKTLTPDDPKILDSLNMNMKYRELYGIDKVQAFGGNCQYQSVIQSRICFLQVSSFSVSTDSGCPQ